FFINHTQLVTESYRRYIENQIRKEYGFTGTPIKIYFKSKYK
ncbi:MAG: hypothetical protein HY779_03800, partial [Rubrobacteridae bacterium]|nr:hypothetical protein [Rubrobacteridae bacterium]